MSMGGSVVPEGPISVVSAEELAAYTAKVAREVEEAVLGEGKHADRLLAAALEEAAGSGAGGSAVCEPGGVCAVAVAGVAGAGARRGSRWSIGCWCRRSWI